MIFPKFKSYVTNSGLSSKFKLFASSLLIFLLFLGLSSSNKVQYSNNFNDWTWKEINEEANWSARAGLQVINIGKSLYLMGGRTPLDPATLPFPVPGASEIWGDVWLSRNYGKNWKRILATDNSSHWPARAYFQAVSKGKYMYIMGGQNFNVVPNPAPPPSFPPFVSQSDFFNDVWRSMDGVNWQQVTPNAPWEGRAGLSAVVFKGEIYIMGGSVNDDSAIIGPGGPVRIYFNDVWKSKNGKHWTRVTDNAPWEPRAGGIAVVKNGYIYMIGGEDGFICNDQTPRCPPYFNDVWRTKNGADWELVTAEAEWPARPGHQVVVTQNRFVLFGGFGLGFDITVPANPMDMWVSSNGKNWKKVSDAPWNAESPADIKYDFDAVSVPNSYGGMSILTFGGDRETFDFSDPLNYLNVDNDVWMFAAPKKKNPMAQLKLYQNKPNPVFSSTKISYSIPQIGKVVVVVYDLKGNRIKLLKSKIQPPGEHSCRWDGRDQNGRMVPSGIYVAKLQYRGATKAIRMIKK